MNDKIHFYFDPNLIYNLKVKRLPNGKKGLDIISKSNVALPGDIIARVVSSDILKTDDVIDEKPFHGIREGNLVSFDKEKNAFIANSYGFIHFDGRKINIDIPLLINKTKTQAVLIVHPNSKGIWPSTDNIFAISKYKNITQTISFKEITELLKKVSLLKPRVVKMLIARGYLPVRGIKAYNKLLIDVTKKVGKLKEDGSIDFHEQDNIIQVNSGDIIGEAVPGIVAKEGLDIYGEKVPSITDDFTSYNMRNNIERTEDGKFVAIKTGALTLDGREVSINEVLLIEGDVDYHQGNIDFNGTVHITKNVKPDFKVKADGDIIIDGDVEDAEIISGGSVIVNKGILSQSGKTRIEAKHDVKAKYIMQSNITAGKNIIVSESIHNSYITAYGRIYVMEKKGQIIGGTATAKYRIEVNNAGSVNENPTIFYVGIDPLLQAKFKELTIKLEDCNKNVELLYKDICLKFSEEFFRNPKEYLKTIRVKERKEELCKLAKEYSSLKEKQKELDETRIELQSQMKVIPEPKIVVHNIVYGGVVLHIYDYVKKVYDKLANTAFLLRNGEIIISPITD